MGNNCFSFFCTIVFFFNLLQYSWFTVLCNNFFFFLNWHQLFPVFWLRYFPSNLFFTAWFFYSHLHNISNPVLIRGHGNKQTMYILVSPFLFSDNKFLSLPCHQLRQEKGETGVVYNQVRFPNEMVILMRLFLLFIGHGILRYRALELTPLFILLLISHVTSEASFLIYNKVKSVHTILWKLNVIT